MSLLQEIKRGIACDTIRDANTVTERVVCLAAHPGKIALFPLVRLYESRYHGKFRFARAVFLFDLVLLGIALGLGLVALFFLFWKPTAFADKIRFEADVAPSEVVSGAPSTLVIRYENGTGEELRDARLSFRFPDHFLLLEMDGGETSDAGSFTAVGTIPVGGTGSVKIRGVMFGDVGGEQTFESTMWFTHGERNLSDQKTSEHTFSPTRSTLELGLTLPEKIVASQPIEGTLAYRNAGEIDFPEIIVEPEWPEGFVLLSSDATVSSGAFHLPSIAAGQEGTMRFKGTLGETAGIVTFRLHPSFAFGADLYRQETLVHEADVVPLPLQVSHGVEADSVRPGQSARVSVTYANIGDEAVRNVRLAVESSSPFAQSKRITVDETTYPELARVEPGQHATVVLSYPLLRSIPQSATSVYENIPFTTRASATFDMGQTRDATARDGELTYVMTSPLVLDAFGRYAAPSGDQIGRGPLPPIVGEATKYWVFWNLRGTTNELTNVHIEGELGQNVTFTGRQTVSQNGGVEYDAATNSVFWTSDSVSPTLSPSSKIVGIAFEVALTPTHDQIGTVPVLLKNIRITATDAVTGAFVSASSATITTDLPNDAMAAGYAAVE